MKSFNATFSELISSDRFQKRVEQNRLHLNFVEQLMRAFCDMRFQSSIGKFILISCAAFFVTMSSANAAGRSFPEFTELVKQASPAVVNITATRKRREVNQFDPRLGQGQGREVPDIFKRFFGDQQGGGRPTPSAGSGFIVSADGYILTNNHVVEGADEIIVALSDRRQREAELIGSDPASDLALLKIDADDLPSVEIGHSEDLEVGEWVVAIGSPFGFELSVTAGIVSAKKRSLPDENGSYVPYIQTDVAINPGNSGGPLFNLDGKVVGINSQIFTRSGGFMGLSFAIPIDVAMEVVEQLKDKGSVSRGWLGVRIQRVDRDLAESFGLDRAAGALVTEIISGSPAEGSDLEEGDIIIKFDGKQVDLSSDLPQIVGRVKPETDVAVEVYRKGKLTKFDVEVGLLEEQNSPNSSKRPAAKLDNRLGLQLKNLTAEQKNRLDVKRGVIVSRVGRGGPASRADLRDGDVITTLDGESISNLSQFNKIMEKLPLNEAIHVRIIRSGTPMFRVIKITE